MQIVVSDQAAEVLLDKVGDTKAFLIALTKEIEETSMSDHSCAKGSQFQIIPLFTEGEVELIPMENPIFTVYSSKEAAPLLVEKVLMDFNPRLNSFQLMCDNQYVDSNIKLKNYFFS
ncbi:iron-sulfur cluster biosynthesis family protein [Enterococcus sp. AZ072]|uniref:iron-sulfur cluster biosynthesis family protein n=1 Tax=unclassified Enterococcus TaxID=2608891 RepID=UPI003D2C7835